MNDQDLERDVQRGNEASQLLNHPMMAEALSNMRQELYDALEDSDWREKDAREEIYRQLKAIQRFERKLEAKIDDGKIAQKSLMERVKDSFR